MSSQSDRDANTESDKCEVRDERRTTPADVEGSKMQTILPSYGSNLIEQADNRLMEAHNGFQQAAFVETESSYHLEQYRYDRDLGKRLSIDSDEAVVDVDDKPDEELNVSDESRCKQHDLTETGCVSTDNVDIGKNYTFQSDIDESQYVDVSSETTKHIDRNVNHHVPSWHPHVYGKPPKKPTPHTIEYILGMNQNASQADAFRLTQPNRVTNESQRTERKREEYNKSAVSQLLNVKRNLDAGRLKPMYKDSQKMNFKANLETELKNKYSVSVQRNRALQEQLLQRNARTSECSDTGADRTRVLGQVYASGAEVEQPLNLSVPKSKDSSGWSADDDERKAVMTGVARADPARARGRECPESPICNRKIVEAHSSSSLTRLIQLGLAQLRTVFGDEAPYKTTIYNWFAEFKHSLVNLDDEFRDCRPSTAVNNKNIVAMRRMIKTDRHVTYNEIWAPLEEA
ncbi:hypothetical protein EVAR_59266_1 [Eumeta japonica]|uniref:Mos1 transposase HTH domain-containing protein n=1 Tax=Eumeta variegata TaxID=151549 RepID=A0A4C1YMI6_EUMVA|nr:hypothetical protein EVAR_59266_1 [Eumeta japonica]